MYYDIRMKLNTDTWKETLRGFTIHSFSVKEWLYYVYHCGEQKIQKDGMVSKYNWMKDVENYKYTDYNTNNYIE